MNYGMMIRTYYHQIVVIVVHRAHKLDNMVDFYNSLIVRLPEVFAADLATKVIERLQVFADRTIKFAEFCQLRPRHDFSRYIATSKIIESFKLLLRQTR